MKTKTLVNANGGEKSETMRKSFIASLKKWSMPLLRTLFNINHNENRTSLRLVWSLAATGWCYIQQTQ